PRRQRESAGASKRRHLSPRPSSAFRHTEHSLAARIPEHGSRALRDQSDQPAGHTSAWQRLKQGPRPYDRCTQSSDRAPPSRLKGRGEPSKESSKRPDDPPLFVRAAIPPFFRSQTGDILAPTTRSETSSLKVGL